MSVKNVVEQMGTALAEAQTNLATAEKQVMFWNTQVTKITAALAACDEIFSPEDFDIVPAKKGKQQARKAEIKTDSAFWLKLFTSTPQKTGDITIAAVNALRLTSDTDKAVIKKRQAGALQNLIKENKIKSVGTGKNRGYFL